MVKSKKLSRGSLAVLLMALMLALSMVVGMTGAWFTDKDAGDSTGTLTFGTIAISTADAEWEVSTDEPRVTYVADIMPGDSVAYSGTVTNSGDPAYVFVKLVATISTGTLPAGAALPNAWTQLKDGSNADVDGVYYVELATNGTQSAALTYEFAGASYGDTYQGATISLSLVFAAVQKANLATAYAAYQAGGEAALFAA